MAFQPFGPSLLRLLSGSGSWRWRGGGCGFCASGCDILCALRRRRQETPSTRVQVLVAMNVWHSLHVSLGELAFSHGECG